MFWTRPGIHVSLRAISAAATRTIAITTHIVIRVLLMLGWNVTSSPAPGAWAGSRSITAWGAGNSSAFSMKQAGKAHSVPADVSLGVWGKATNARTSRTSTTPTRASQRGARPRRRDAGAGGVGEAPATGRVAACSLVTLPPPGPSGRLDAARCRCRDAVVRRSLDRV